jgi:hypothetical protein
MVLAGFNSYYNVSMFASQQNKQMQNRIIWFYYIARNLIYYGNNPSTHSLTISLRLLPAGCDQGHLCAAVVSREVRGNLRLLHYQPSGPKPGGKLPLTIFLLYVLISVRPILIEEAHPRHLILTGITTLDQ